MISAIIPATTTAWAVYAGPAGEVRFARVQCWAVTEILSTQNGQVVSVGRAITGVMILNGQLAPCNGANVLDFVGYDETRAAFKNVQPGLVTPDPAPWAAKCQERRKTIEAERAAAKASKIILPTTAGAPDPAWSAAKDLKALRSGENPLN